MSTVTSAASAASAVKSVVAPNIITDFPAWYSWALSFRDPISVG